MELLACLETLESCAMQLDVDPFNMRSTIGIIFCWSHASATPRNADLERPIHPSGPILAFNVKSKTVKAFKLKGQLFMCGASPADVPVAVAKIKLNASGQGKGTFTMEFSRYAIVPKQEQDEMTKKYREKLAAEAKK